MQVSFAVICSHCQSLQHRCCAASPRRTSIVGCTLACFLVTAVFGRLESPSSAREPEASPEPSPTRHLGKPPAKVIARGVIKAREG